jgi:hypothetical protein
MNTLLSVRFEALSSVRREVEKEFEFPQNWESSMANVLYIKGDL